MKLMLCLVLSLVALLVVTGMLLLGCARPALAAAPPVADETLELGRRWTDRFYRGRTAELWEQLDDRVRQLFGTPAGLDAFRAKVEQQLGAERAILDERAESSAGTRLYTRVAQFERGPAKIDVLLAFDKGGRITSFGITPDRSAAPAATTKLDYHTRAALRLPFAGAWTVGWGGRTVELNYHVADRGQRFAYDFGIMRDGSTHRGDGKHNRDYYCYGQPIFAPAAGTIVLARDGIAENVPGEMNADEPAGNHVVVDHGNGEYSFLAHLIPGSVTVRVGARVSPGQLIGRCGNSGHSSEPHLHYHLQDTPRLHDGAGLPAQFRDYRADGTRVASGEPTRGQIIEAVTSAGP